MYPKENLKKSARICRLKQHKALYLEKNGRPEKIALEIVS